MVLALVYDFVSKVRVILRHSPLLTREQDGTWLIPFHSADLEESEAASSRDVSLKFWSDFLGNGVWFGLSW